MHMSREPLCICLLVLAAVLGFSIPASASDSDTDRKSGFVDGSAFLELADKDSAQVEVSIKGPLLKLLSNALASEDEEAARMVGDLESIYALVIGIGEKNRDAAAERVRKMSDGLKKKGWEPIARVQEEDTNVTVMINADDKTINGLVVIVIDIEEGQLVFANIAGKLKLDEIEKLSAKLDVPGLDDVFGKGRGADKEKKKERSKATKKETKEKDEKKAKKAKDEDEEDEDDEWFR